VCCLVLTQTGQQRAQATATEADAVLLRDGLIQELDGTVGHI
jgi:hypothetical protein